MAELTLNGLTINRFNDIKNKIQTEIQSRVSSNISFDEDLILTQIVNILATEMSRYEEVLLNLYSSLDRDKAEGVALDNLLYWLGLERISAAKTSGLLEVVTEDNSNIALGTLVKNPSSGDLFATTQAILSSVSACIQSEHIVSSLPISTLIRVTINGIDFDYTTDADPTEEEVVDGLVTVINASVSPFTASKSLTPTRLVVTSDNETNIAVEVLEYLTPYRSKVLVPVQALEEGPIKAPQYSVTEVVTSIGGLVSSTNPKELGIGRFRETDEEFRARASQSLAVSGSATYAAMLTAIRNLDNVSNVLIEENETNTTNALGLPPHSFQVIVNAPEDTDTDQLIANTIWNEKPLGIQTFGDTAVTITDITNTDRVINFSRPQAVVLATRVTYSLYDEEQLTDNLETVMKKAIESYGNGLTSGQDVIPTRFIGSLYANTQGIIIQSVEMQTLVNTGTAPVGGNWAETPISILPAEYATFNTQDMYFVGV